MDQHFACFYTHLPPAIDRHRQFGPTIAAHCTHDVAHGEAHDPAHTSTVRSYEHTAHRCTTRPDAVRTAKLCMDCQAHDSAPHDAAKHCMHLQHQKTHMNPSKALECSEYVCRELLRCTTLDAPERRILKVVAACLCQKEIKKNHTLLNRA